MLAIAAAAALWWQMPRVASLPEREGKHSAADEPFGDDDREGSADPFDEESPSDGNDVAGSDAVADTHTLGKGPWTSVSREAGELEQVATRLLGSYRDAGNCALAYAGYIDLVGSVWACAVVGDGWSDVCVVQKLSSEVSEVRVLRIGAEEMTGVLAGQGDG